MATTVALAGNPNSGKTTLFNQLTGNHQYVGNWPGVTVERKTGVLKDDKDVEIVDLPGIYSLSPYSNEEVVARNYLAEGDPDVIVDIVDASNLERNLYLTTQLMEFGVPVVVALNQMDIVKKRGYKIESDELSARLGLPVVEISALKGDGIDECVRVALKAAAGKTAPKHVRFSPALEERLEKVEVQLPDSVPAKLRRYCTLKLFERDVDVLADFDIDIDVEGICSSAEAELGDRS